MQYKFNSSKLFVKKNYKKNVFAASMFNTICIQTASTCQRSCFHCPANKIPNNNLKNGLSFMSDEVFDKILCDLQSIKYTGSVAPYLYSEPYLEKDYESRLRKIKKKLPKATLNTYTNGINLTKDRIIETMEAGTNFLWINVYDEKTHNKLNPILTSLRDSHPTFFGKDTGLQNQKLSEQVIRYKAIFSTGKPSDADRKWNNRGGMLQGSCFGELDTPIVSTCVQPFRMFFVTLTGESVLCCSDWQNVYSFGNVKNKHLLDLWNDVDRQRIRKMLYHKDRNIPMCDKCSCGGGAYKHAITFADTLEFESINETKKNIWKVFGKKYKSMLKINTDEYNTQNKKNEVNDIVSEFNESVETSNKFKKNTFKKVQLKTEVSDQNSKKIKKNKKISIKRLMQTKHIELIPRVPTKTKEEKAKKRKVWKEEDKMSFKNMNSSKYSKK